MTFELIKIFIGTKLYKNNNNERTMFSQCLHILKLFFSNKVNFLALALVSFTIINLI